MAGSVARLCFLIDIMRLILPFLALALLVLIPWMIWGGQWDERFTLEGSVR